MENFREKPTRFVFIFKGHPPIICFIDGIDATRWNGLEQHCEIFDGETNILLLFEKES